MPIINFEALHFPYKYGLGNTVHTLNCTWSDILLAAVTVGRKNWEWVTKNGVLSEREMSFRINMILAFLKENSRSQIVRTQNFITLDPSEKVAISYFLGLVGTKLMAEKVFNVPWLMHLDVYTRFATGSDRVFIEKWKEHCNIRPDLIGLDTNGDWVVVEAKGRTNNMSHINLAKAKSQTENIRKINGQDPILRFANSTYFSQNIWHFSLLDPEEFHESAPDIEITQGQFLRDYYATIFHFLQHKESEKIKYNNHFFTVRTLKGTTVKVGIETNLFSNLKEYQYDEQIVEEVILSSCDDFKYTEDNNYDYKEKKKNILNNHISVGNDGVIISY